MDSWRARRTKDRASGGACWKEATSGGDGSTGRDMQRSAEKTSNCRNVLKGSYSDKKPHGSPLGGPLACESTGNTISVMVAMASRQSQRQVDTNCLICTRIASTSSVGKILFCKRHGDGSAERTCEVGGMQRRIENLRAVLNNLSDCSKLLFVASFGVLSQKKRYTDGQTDRERLEQGDKPDRLRSLMAKT